MFTVYKLLKIVFNLDIIILTNLVSKPMTISDMNLLEKVKSIFTELILKCSIRKKVGSLKEEWGLKRHYEWT